MIERLITPITAWHGRLRATIRRVDGTLQAHMDVVIMAIPRAHLGHPRLIILALNAAEFFFYRSIDEDALDLRLLGRSLDEGHIRWTPSFVIDVLSIRGDHIAA